MQKIVEISVIIPVYNAEKYLERAVMSALDQPETGEVILVEDDSPDNALELCQKLEKEHEKVKLFRHPDGKNHGAGASRNLGIKKAQFDYIAFLDADDYYLPNRFKKTVEVFNEHSDADGVYECIGSEFLDEEGRKRYNNTKVITTVKEIIAPENLFENMAPIGSKGYFHINAFTAKKRIFGDVLFDEELRLCQDALFNLQLAAKKRLYPGLITAPVSIRGVHKNNRIADKEKFSCYYYLFAKKLFQYSIENLDKKKVFLVWRLYRNAQRNNSSKRILFFYKEFSFIFKTIILCPKILSVKRFYFELPVLQSILNYDLKKRYLKLCLLVKKKLVLGSGKTKLKGWIPTDIDILNITSEKNWKAFVPFGKLKAVLMEHVLEHLTEEDAKKGLRNIFKYLKRGGYVRIAVPDGFHKSLEYIGKVKPGGTGAGADDHKVLYNYKSLIKIMNECGFECDLLEYWDEEGMFHHKEWSSDDGMIMRSLRFDKRNVDGDPVYTSLIVDGIKK
jgi:predicted SAM-dependent methyltransferase